MCASSRKWPKPLRTAATGREGGDAVAALADAYRHYLPTHPHRTGALTSAPDEGAEVDLAMAVVDETGPDSLPLAKVAERAGVAAPPHLADLRVWRRGAFLSVVGARTDHVRKRRSAAWPRERRRRPGTGDN